ncbi:hypothetical protein [Noviherbaspirillum autotrophicum]|uniref:Uncharacterized protein n=1 Tax=Noviherbaspirillum autotrophicum TaxID=709839 RepID=A0A0C2BZ45_9BURK|nr:hypothetical protein [Noviherbaspirillum autotrophicum]KIF83291.1 hypothetical protein TSA66_24605 [Noviherbaspirillum autotrophicum]
MFFLNETRNQRFDGHINVTVGDQMHTLEADRFELVEGDTRHIGDGDQLYSELWKATPEEPEEPGTSAAFDSVHVTITRLNDGPYEFAGPAEVIGAPAREVEVADELELLPPDEQGPGVDPY